MPDPADPPGPATSNNPSRALAQPYDPLSLGIGALAFFHGRTAYAGTGEALGTIAIVAAVCWDIGRSREPRETVERLEAYLKEDDQSVTFE